MAASSSGRLPTSIPRLAFQGGTNLSDALSYQTSAIGGALGSDRDELANYDQFEGYLSGPIPGTSQRLRFLAAGRATASADRLLNFDDDVARASGLPTDRDPRLLAPNVLDVFPGWRAFGYDQTQDLTAKLTYYFTPTAKLSVEGIGYQRKRLPFDFDYLLTGFNPLQAPSVDNIEDSLSVGSGGGIVAPPVLGGTGNFTFKDVVVGSINVERTMFAAKWPSLTFISSKKFTPFSWPVAAPLVSMRPVA